MPPLVITLRIDAGRQLLEAPGIRYALPEPGIPAREFAHPFAAGRVSSYAFPGGIGWFLYEFEVHAPFRFETVNPPQSGTYCLFVNLSETPVTKMADGKLHTLQRSLPGGLLWYSPGNTLSLEYLPGQVFRFLSCTCTREGLQALVPAAELDLLLPAAPPFVRFEESDPESSRLLNLLQAPAGSGLDRMHQYSHCLALMHRLLARNQQPSAQPRLLGSDLERLFQARAVLLARLSRPPGIEELARMTGFSVSKLKSAFKAVFGLPVHQYVQQFRMQKARELLEAGRCSVSEAGYEVGYSNLSHFTAAFRKQFGLNPSQIAPAVSVPADLRLR
ncbi:MAG: AraC family transcriptional regulator [Bacteroidia bacterium]|nr:AraC family transcriptional regulator [Bacteroidia bacterium]